MRKFKVCLFGLWILVLILPYLLGAISSNNEMSYSGFLLNPIDGYSYLAKMRQGLEGSWVFQLTYSPTANQDVFLFLFYLLLGHISDWFNASLIAIFHVSRLISSIFLFWVISDITEKLFSQNVFLYKLTITILLFGGGLGWVYLFIGDLPVDFWVAEAYPFLSSLVNPHFPLSLLLILLMLDLLVSNSDRAANLWIIFVSGFILANVSPFGALIGGLLFVYQFFWDLLVSRKFKVKYVLLYFLSSFPVVFYQVIVVRNDPILSIWNQQNQTPAPGILNLFFSFSPFLIGILIILGVLIWKKNLRFSKIEGLLFSWLSIAILFVYLPINLQRRFLVGIYFPFVVLFFLFLGNLLKLRILSMKNLKTISIIVLLISIPSSLLVYTGGLNAVITRNANLFTPREIVVALQWMNKNLPSFTVVASSPDTGLLIPAYTNQRVIYGHPFESVDSKPMESKMFDLFANDLHDPTLDDELKELGVDYIFWGPYENELKDILNFDLNYDTVYENSGVKIYEIVR